MKLTRRILTLTTCGMLTLLLLASQSGCLVAAAAAGTGAGVAYVRGDTEVVLDAGCEQVTNAAKAAVEDMHLALVSSQASAVDGKVVARTAQDAKVKVTVKAQGDKMSKVSIRVGVFGDQAMQMSVLDKIKSKLGMPIATGPTTVPTTQTTASTH